MNRFLSNKKLIGILVSVIIIAALIALSVNRTGNVNPVQRGINDVTSFAGKIVTAPVNAITTTFDSVTDLMNTFEENKHLKNQVERTDELRAQLEAKDSENQRLQEELDLTHSLTDFQNINATVISRNPDTWIDQLVVDRGSQNGVEMGMPVMSQSGLVGRVSEVGPTSAKVTLVTTTDQRQNLVSAEVQTEDDEVVHGVIESYDETTNRLIMDQITSNAELQEGQEVVTSGLSNQTPRSLIIGTIDEVVAGDFGLSQRVYITPATDFSDIRYVTIVMKEAGDGDVVEEDE